MDLVADRRNQIQDALASALASWKRPARLRHHVIFAGSLTLIVACIAYLGVVTARVFAVDVLSAGENAWRVANGLRPHQDFVSGWGPLAFLPGAAGVAITGDINGLGYGRAIFGAAVGVWAYIVCSRRMGGAPGVCLSLMLVLLCVAPNPLGEPFWDTSQAMYYNRYGYCLLGIALIECFPLRDDRVTEGLGGAVSTGMAVAAMAFIKSSYAMAAVPLILFSLVWPASSHRRRIVGLCAGLVVGAAPMLGYLHFHISRMLADLALVGRLRAEWLDRGQFIEAFWASAEATLVILGLALVATKRGAVEGSSGLRQPIQKWRIPGFVVLVYALGIAITCTNFQSPSFPLNAILAFLLAARIASGETGLPRRFAFGCAICALGVIMPVAGADALSIVTALHLKQTLGVREVWRIPFGGFKPLIMLNEQPDPTGHHGGAPEVASYVTDGVELLQRASLTGEQVATFDQYNPFPFALLQRPPRGGMAQVMYDYFYSDLHHPSAYAFFGDAHVVMYPKKNIGGVYWAGLVKTYERDLHALYEPVAESDLWILYRRRD